MRFQYRRQMCYLRWRLARTCRYACPATLPCHLCHLVAPLVDKESVPSSGSLLTGTHEHPAGMRSAPGGIRKGRRSLAAGVHVSQNPCHRVAIVSLGCGEKARRREGEKRYLEGWSALGPPGQHQRMRSGAGLDSELGYSYNSFGDCRLLPIEQPHKRRADHQCWRPLADKQTVIALAAHMVECRCNHRA